MPGWVVVGWLDHSGFLRETQMCVLLLAKGCHVAPRHSTTKNTLGTGSDQTSGVPQVMGARVS